MYQIKYDVTKALPSKELSTRHTKWLGKLFVKQTEWKICKQYTPAPIPVTLELRNCQIILSVLEHFFKITIFEFLWILDLLLQIGFMLCHLSFLFPHDIDDIKCSMNTFRWSDATLTLYGFLTQLEIILVNILIT